MIVVYPHIPKCAGSLARDMFIGEGDLYPVFWLDLGSESFDQFFRKCSSALNSHEDLVIGGHFTLRMILSEIPCLMDRSDLFILTIIRDPFERLCSHYDYHKRLRINIDLLDESSDIPSSEDYLTGILRSNLGVMNRFIYNYYLGTGPYSDEDIEAFYHSISKYRVIVTTLANVVEVLQACLSRLASIKNFNSLQPLIQFLQIGDFMDVKVNCNPKQPKYALKYPAEYANKDLMFTTDYIIYGYAATLGGSEKSP